MCDKIYRKGPFSFSTLFVAVSLLFVLLSSSYAEVKRVTIMIKGMACPFCAYGVEKKLKRVKGVKGIDIDIQKGMARLTAEEGQSIEISQVPGAIEDAGFTPDRITATVTGRIERNEKGNLILKSREGQRTFNLTGDRKLIEGYIGSDVAVTGEVIVQKEKPWTINVERVEKK